MRSKMGSTMVGRQTHRRLVQHQQASATTQARGRSPPSAARRPTACRRVDGCAAPAPGTASGYSAGSRPTRAGRPRSRRPSRDSRARSGWETPGGLRAHGRCRDAAGRQARTLARSWPSKRMRPATGVTAPEMALKSVVLPAPFGPTIDTKSPLADLDRHAVERLEATVGHMHPVKLEHTGSTSCRGRPRSPADRASPSCGSPSASTAP